MTTFTIHGSANDTNLVLDSNDATVTDSGYAATATQSSVITALSETAALDTRASGLETRVTGLETKVTGLETSTLIYKGAKAAASDWFKKGDGAVYEFRALSSLHTTLYARRDCGFVPCLAKSYERVEVDPNSSSVTYSFTLRPGQKFVKYNAVTDSVDVVRDILAQDVVDSLFSYINPSA